MHLPFSSEDRVLGEDEEFSLPANYMCYLLLGLRQGTGDMAGSWLQKWRKWKITDFVIIMRGRKWVMNKDILLENASPCGRSKRNTTLSPALG